MSQIKTREIARLESSSSVLTEMLQDALSSAKTVILDSGIYLTGPLKVPSDTTLVINKGATLKFIDDFEAYPPVFTRWEGEKCWCMHPCLFISDSQNVTVKGEGTIDGSGKAWWDERRRRRDPFLKQPIRPIEKRLALMNPDYKNQPSGGGGRETQFLRPPLLQIKSSSNVRLEGVLLKDSPFWTLHPLLSKDITIENVRVENPADAPNTDGIDIESCSHVTVSNCFVHVGDDGIALKSGSGIDGIRDGIPAKDVLIKGCTVRSAHGGAVIGSETAGGIEDIKVEDCLFDGTERGVRIKTRRGRGGKITGLLFKNIEMRDNLCPFVINMYYRCGSNCDADFSLTPQPITESTPEIESVHLENCRAENCQSSAGMIVGLPERPIHDVVVKDCNFSVARDASRPVSDSAMYLGLPVPESRGFRFRNAFVKLDNLTVECEGEKIIIEENVSLDC